MAVTSQAAVISASYACKFSFNSNRWNSGKTRNCPTRTIIRASSDESDCNSEECAPDKEVGKVSMEWVAEERTKVVGTFPPRTRGWTGYIEKDTAGQTNIYSVEPAVYVAESAISSGNRGSSADGSENTAGLIAFLALISVAAASSILLQVGKTAPPVQATRYSGPPLNYYIDKLKSPETVEAAAPVSVVESSLEAPEIVEATAASVTVVESSIDAPQVEAETAVLPPEPSTSGEAN